MNGRILVLGADGMLGRELVNRFRSQLGDGAGERVVAWDIADVDIRERDAVFDAVSRVSRCTSGSVVANAAAYTDVDGCETNTELAMAVNGKGPGHIAQACKETGSTLVHFGTDFIFDGRSERPYRPDDEANPLSVYGRSKWEGEQRVRASGCHHLIIRTSWLFGPHGHNFVETILSRARCGDPVSVVTDQVGSPTLASDLAEAVIRLLDAGARSTVHFANSGHCSWFEFAEEIVRQAAPTVRPTGKSVAQLVRPIRSDQLGRPAKRPAYSVLDSTRYVELVGQTPPPWQDALGRYLKGFGRTGKDHLCPTV